MAVTIISFISPFFSASVISASVTPASLSITFVASVRVPSGNYDDNCNSRKRHRFCQTIVNDFWKRWHRLYFDTLIIQQKWHTTKRNLSVGDIVLLQDSNVIRGKWRLAEVCEAIAGNDGNVRDVKVRYKPLNDSQEYTGC